MRIYLTFTLVVLIALLSGCASRPTHFTLDPEIYSASINNRKDKAFMINVIAPNKPPSNTQDKQYLMPANDFTQAIKTGVIGALVEKGYSVSANKHFSNFTMTLDFSQFEVAINTGLVKDELEVQAQLIITLATKKQSYKKTFGRGQTLIVALKATDAEITGLTNQVAGYLLKSALSDPEIVKFINRL